MTRNTPGLLLVEVEVKIGERRRGGVWFVQLVQVEVGSTGYDSKIPDTKNGDQRQDAFLPNSYKYLHKTYYF